MKRSLYYAIVVAMLLLSVCLIATIFQLEDIRSDMDRVSSRIDQLSEDTERLKERVDSWEPEESEEMIRTAALTEATPAESHEIQIDEHGTTTLTCRVTAYCTCPTCCGIWSDRHPSRIGTDYVQKTSTGTIPTEGRTIATDQSVIPAGTHVIINGHEYIAEDTGGAIKGNRIDIFFDTHEEAVAWGVQELEVDVIEGSAE